MNKTDDILEKLQTMQQPVIDNPDEMVEKIISLLPASTRGGNETSRVLIFMRTVLSFAAMWIVGFFIYLQYDVATPSEITASPREGQEGASTLREVYKYRFCQDCKKTISYTQIKSMLYENK